jgi:CheY-like chemotaxis protein
VAIVYCIALKLEYGIVHRYKTALAAAYGVPMPKTILIADDSQMVRQTVRSHLESRLDQVICAEATDGLDAIEYVRRVKPELIVLDVSMPVMNGLEAAPILHSIVPEAPIILFTLHKDLVPEEEAKAVGICAVVSKIDLIEVLVDQILSVSPFVRVPIHKPHG